MASNKITCKKVSEMRIPFEKVFPKKRRKKSRKFDEMLVIENIKDLDLFFVQSRQKTATKYR